MIKLIRQLETSRKTDETSVGTKAAILGELANIGIAQVPPGFVVTADGFDLFLKKAKLDLVVAKELKNLNYNDAKALNQTADHISYAIKKTPLSAKLEQSIAKAYEDLSKKMDGDTLVAVRPSLVTKNHDGAPLAGPELTFLNLKGSRQIVTAVHKLFAQTFEAPALYYRHLHNLDQGQIKLAVIVQEMVFPETAGVLVSTDPILHDPDKAVVEAVWGLGDGLVSGTMSPDRYIVDKRNLQVISQKITKQTWKLDYAGGVTSHVSIAVEDQQKPKLNSESLLELTRLGISLERHFHLPYEVEWAIDNKTLWVVDGRPASAKASLRQTNRWKIVPVSLGGKPVVKPTAKMEPGAVGEVLARGIGASLGLSAGKVVIVHSAKEASDIAPGSVLVTETTSPLYIQGMRQAVGVVTDTGGATSHASLAARELGIPAVVGTGQGTHNLTNGQIVTVDGIKGLVYKGRIHPNAIRDDHKLVNSQPVNSSTLITGTKVYVNLSDPTLAQQVAKQSVDGVGLMRAEMLIAQIGEHPLHAIKANKTKAFSEKLQDAILQVAQAFTPRPVMYRLNDFKTNEYRDLKGGNVYEPQEANPMLGWRGARRYVDQPEVVQMELGAIAQLRKSGVKNVHIVIPFIRTISELKQVAFLIEKAGLIRGRDFKVWMMVEVPSNFLLLDQFAGVGIDGISIGTNDLTQLILGVDRDNERLAQNYDERDPAVVKAVREVIKRARGLGLTTSVCGNAASMYPEFLETVVRSGITSVSVTPDVTNETRKLISSIEKRIILDHAISY